MNLILADCCNGDVWILCFSQLEVGFSSQGHSSTTIVRMPT